MAYLPDLKTAGEFTTWNACPSCNLAALSWAKSTCATVSPPVEPSRKMSEFPLKIQKKHSMFMVYSNSSFLVDNFFCMFCLTHLRNRVNVMAKPTTVLVCPMILDCQTSRGWCGSCKQNFLINMFFFIFTPSFSVTGCSTGYTGYIPILSSDGIFRPKKIRSRFGFEPGGTPRVSFTFLPWDFSSFMLYVVGWF